MKFKVSTYCCLNIKKLRYHLTLTSGLQLVQRIEKVMLRRDEHEADFVYLFYSTVKRSSILDLSLAVKILKLDDSLIN